MHDDLYFIAVIDAAVDQPDRRASLRAAFEQIRRMGEARRYRQGYRQFLHWMRHVARARQDLESARAGTPMPEVLDRPAWIELLIERDGALVAATRIESPGRTLVRGITPGVYRFRLDTGCVLWAGFVSEQGEFVSRPAPGRPLRMAAATTGAAALRDEMRLFDGAMFLRLRPDGPAWLLEIESSSPEV